MPKTIPVEQVPVSFNSEKIVVVCNPLTVDFECSFAGQPVVVKSGAMVQMTQTKAAHVAKHLAIKIMNDRSVQFLQDKFPGLTEEGREKWKVQGNIFFTRMEVIELAKTFLVEDYNIGEEKPKIPGAKTKYDKKGEEEDVEPPKGTGKAPDESEDEEGADDNEEEDESNADKKPAKKGKK